MGWSTRELAELAGTSLRTVRHYHDVGLLPEPERRANGYKTYAVAHLVRLLRIKRLAGLGFSLAQIAEMGDADEHPEEALQSLDSQLAATIERLQRIRAELAMILHRETPADLASTLSSAATNADLSDADRALLVVLAQVMGPSDFEAYVDLMQNYHRDPSAAEFDNLPADADEQTRSELTERLAPHVRALYSEHPEMGHWHTAAPRGAPFAMRSLGVAIADLYNSAQIDVLVRVGREF
jgi:DNA-binding transcriptional MerR regulator